MPFGVLLSFYNINIYQYFIASTPRQLSLRLPERGSYNIFAHITPVQQTEGYVIKNQSEDPTLINPQQFVLYKNCFAYKICKDFIDNPSTIDKIISFNYTPLVNYIQNIVAETVKYDIEAFNKKIKELDLENRFTPVHISRNGCLLPNDNLGGYPASSSSSLGICGIDDNIKLPDNMKFFLKSEQFDDTSVREDVINYINNADDLIIFGHSLGLCDSDYFKDLFCKLFSEYSENKRVTIVTYDNKKTI